MNDVSPLEMGMGGGGGGSPVGQSRSDSAYDKRNRMIMKLILLGLAICLSSTAQAQAQESKVVLLNHAAHCLASKGFLAQTKAKKLTFGYLLDEKSYPDARMLYVVNYLDSSGPDGYVFTIFMIERQGRRRFNIQNNAVFAVSTHGRHEVSFVDPPLGGSCTREHLISAIQQIEKQPRFTISAEDLLEIDSAISCEAYTDPQPGKRGQNKP